MSAAILPGLMCNLNEHKRQGACYLCCPRCNQNAHYCPGCGVDLPHDKTSCGDCRKELLDERDY